MTRRTIVHIAAAVLALGTTALSPAPAAPSFDLPALLECRADIPAYVAFRQWIGQGGAPVTRAGFAWRRSTAFQAEYALSRGTHVFGMPAGTIGLSDNGVLAVVTGTTPARAAARLGIEPMLATPTMFIANKLVSANDAAKAHAGEVQVAPTDLDALFGVKPTRPTFDAQEIVQIVTDLGQHGRTMVGCNYISSALTMNLPFPRR